MTCDCGARHNSGFHSSWCSSLAVVTNTRMDAKSRAYCIEELTQEEVRLFDLFMMGKINGLHPDMQYPSKLYHATLGAISMGFG